MSYTSPSPANVGLNGNQTTWWIPARNLSTHTVTNVIVTVTVAPSAGLAPVTYVADTGVFNFTTGIWNVGTLAAGATKWLKIVTSVTDIGLAPFTITSVISGNGIDPNALNNTLVQTIDSVVCNPSAGALGIEDGCNCVDVSVNDTPCTHGTTEWRITPLSITNSTTYVWDVETGKGRFTYVDFTLPITFSYSIWCDVGSGFLQTSGPAVVTIPALIEDVAPLNHTFERINGADLTEDERDVIALQYPLYSNGDIASFCWMTLKNADGEVTSAFKVDCTDDAQTRTFYLCTETECDASPECDCDSVLPVDIVLPVDYLNPETGDTIILRHVTQYATSVWVYNGSNWARNSCGCLQDAVPIDTIAFTGTTTKTLTITFEDGTTKTASFTDNSPSAGTGDDWGAQVIEHAPCSPSSGDGTALDPLLINEVVASHRFSSSELNPDSSFTANVSSYFDEPCPGGCDPTYEIGGYSSLVYDSVTLTGTTLNANIKSTAPAGNHPIIINRTCA